MKILRKINDFFFKTECLGCQTKGSLLCDECLSRLSQLEMNFCPFCFKISKFGSTCSFCQKRRSLDGAIVALNYQDPLVRKLIKSAKYKPFLSALLLKSTKCLTEKVRRSPLYKNYFLKEKFILVPIPLTRRKEAERGFNQAEIIARELATQLNLPLDVKTLKKIINAGPQSHLNLKERRKNIEHSFWAASSKGKNFILVDDLITSGSTIDEATKTLKKAGAYKIWAFALARNLKNPVK
ncbi:MAG: hypothetical protein AUK09_00395 [Parcubacteria group bacterium CG2_30_36_38]|nr:MAG: hypothetical protein AUK09_00395 [Parcubacteria group bacterium CG2_30_36_38]